MSPRQIITATAPQSAGPPGLLGGAMDLLAEINGQCLDLLCTLAEAGHAAAPVGADMAPYWQRLTAEPRRRLAAAPYLLADAGFSDEARWRSLQVGGVHDQQRKLPVSVFGIQNAAAFSRRVLVFGWHLARSQPSAARRTNCGFTSMLCSIPLRNSLAFTTRIPSASIKNCTSTFGNPAGIPGIPVKLNSANFRLSFTKSLSP